MASTAATVLFSRPARMSRRAVLTGFFVGAGAVCAGADAAINSKGEKMSFIFTTSSPLPSDYLGHEAHVLNSRARQRSGSPWPRGAPEYSWPVAQPPSE